MLAELPEASEPSDSETASEAIFMRTLLESYKDTCNGFLIGNALPASRGRADKHM